MPYSRNEFASRAGVVKREVPYEIREVNWAGSWSNGPEIPCMGTRPFFLGGGEKPLEGLSKSSIMVRFGCSRLAGLSGAPWGTVYGERKRRK